MSEDTAPVVDEEGPVDPAAAEVEALLAERAGYVARGLDGRVAEVDEQLALRGHGEAAQARAKAAPKGAKGRAQAPADQA